MIYLLQVHLIGQENLNGRVFVPPGVLLHPSEPSEELKSSLPLGVVEKTYKDLVDLFNNFSEQNPEMKRV
jgi:hypothetical protein